MSEIALISARKSRLTADAKKGSKGAKTALKLAEDPDKFLSTIQIGITLIGILTGLYSGEKLADEAGKLFLNWGLSPTAAHNVGQTLIVIIVTYLSIVVGELVPKRIGLIASNTMAKIIAPPMRLLSIVALPLVWILSASTSLLSRILGLKKSDNGVTEEEIKSLIQDGTDSGEVLKVEQDIMERALVMGDLKVSSIMTPKSDVASMYLDMTAAEVREQLSEELHTSYPVYSDDERRTVCGIVTLKKLILTLDNKDFVLKNVVTEPAYFPESMNAYDALERMKSHNVHFAIVCDEFGDMAGVITPSDILDGLVGSLELHDSAHLITPGKKPDEWVVDAKLPIYDFLSHFNLEDLYHPSSYATVGGLILDQLQHVPAVGEKTEWNGITFEVRSMDGARIASVLVTLPHKDDKEEEE